MTTEPPPVLRRPVDRRAFLRALGIGGSALGAGGLLAACGSGSGASSSVSPGGSPAPSSLGDMAFQLSWFKDVQFAGEYFADKQGFYRAAGLSSVNLLAGGGETPTETVVLSGQALVGLSSTPVAGAAIAKGGPLKIIGAIYQQNPFCILSLQEKTPIRTVADLKGKKLGLVSDNQLPFYAFLKANGLEKSDIDIVAGSYSVSELESGTYDAQVAFTTDEVIAVQLDGFTPVTIDFSSTGLPFVMNPYVTSEDNLANKRDILKAFMMAEIQGWTAAVKDPDAAATYAVDDYGKGLNLAQQKLQARAQNVVTVSDDTNKNGLLTISDRLQNDTVTSLAGMGTKLTATTLFDTSILHEIYSAHPELIVDLSGAVS